MQSERAIVMCARKPGDPKCQQKQLSDAPVEERA